MLIFVDNLPGTCQATKGCPNAALVVVRAIADPGTESTPIPACWVHQGTVARALIAGRKRVLLTEVTR